MAPDLKTVRRGGIAALAALALISGCSLQPAPQFQVSGTGNISGILFLDRDGNGQFDPSAGDSALGNVHLQVYNRGTTTTFPGGDLHTDSLGRFTVPNIPAGTQSIEIDTTGISTKVSFCNNPVPVSVYLNETAFVAVNGQGGCVVSIDSAQNLPLNSRITIKGTVTSTVAQISTGQAYVEDATGGIELFSPTGSTFNIGDVIEVSGTLTTFSGEFEVSPVTVNTVTPGTPLDPFVVTSSDAASAAGDVKANLQGRLIEIKAGKLIDVFTTGAGRNAQIDDGSGAVAVRFDSHVVADTNTLKTTFTAGKCYNWTGILKGFTNPGVELFPRTLSEAVEVPCP
ncbi:MAG TPA: hypothetical protein VHW65_08990 [Gemmatimonadales bacterium]|jgi:hypothetical protein|nr:hypothetical protein [Gemmatimonadales bacterium]